MQPHTIIREVCSLLTTGDSATAAQYLVRNYPLPSLQTKRSPWSTSRMLRVYLRDGFTDRYFGEPLIFPGTLRVLSILLPKEFPYQKNWKQSQTHPAYWALSPTIDHVVPIARGGSDDLSNVVTTSMVRNAAKANWLLEELEWPSIRAPVIKGWDGLLSWFFFAYENFEVVRNNSATQTWYRAARQETHSIKQPT